MGIATRKIRKSGATSMSREAKILWIIIISLFGLLISVKLYQHFKFQNIYDEIYYDGAGKRTDLWLRRRSSLGNLEEINKGPRVIYGVDEILTLESYDSEKLTDGLANLSVSFSQKEKSIVVYFRYEMEEGVSLCFENTYSVKDSTLLREIFIKDESVKVFSIKDKEEVDKYLSQYDIDSEKLEELYDNGMTKFLNDWVSVYSSKYSAEELGDVEIITDW